MPKPLNTLHYTLLTTLPLPNLSFFYSFTSYARYIFLKRHLSVTFLSWIVNTHFFRVVHYCWHRCSHKIHFLFLTATPSPASPSSPIISVFLSFSYYITRFSTFPTAPTPFSLSLSPSCILLSRLVAGTEYPFSSFVLLEQRLTPIPFSPHNTIYVCSLFFFF